MGVVRWADDLQRRRRWAGLPLAVIYKMTDDQASYLVALIAYYGALQVGVAVQNAMNKIWAVPCAERPALPGLCGRSPALTAILAPSIATTTGLSALSTAAGTYGTAGVDTALRVGAVVVSMVAQLWPGALTVSVLWQILQTIGTYLVEHQLRGATATYGLFGIVLGLLTWLYLAALILMLGAEINVVQARRLYPRSLLAPDPTDTALTRADRRAYASYAETERAKDHQTVETEFEAPPSNSHH